MTALELRLDSHLAPPLANDLTCLLLCFAVEVVVRYLLLLLAREPLDRNLRLFIRFRDCRFIFRPTVRDAELPILDLEVPSSFRADVLSRPLIRAVSFSVSGLTLAIHRRRLANLLTTRGNVTRVQSLASRKPINARVTRKRRRMVTFRPTAPGCRAQFPSRVPVLSDTSADE